VKKPAAAAVLSDAAPEKSPKYSVAERRLEANRQATPKNAFTDLIAARRLDPGVILIALVVAVGLGAFHALEPGHGKTLVAAYLVGSRGTMRHALWLGLIVTAAHTAGVYLLGGATLYASRYVVPERLYPWLSLASGALITVMGVALFLRRYRAKSGAAAAHGHAHSHGHHSHAHYHHHHHHDEAVSLRELFALGVGGGIIPCPAALVVLLSAVALQRVGFGLLLIVAFSAGLAAVLIAVGLLVVYARRFAGGFAVGGSSTIRWLPLASSAFIVLFGIALSWQGLAAAGLIRL
jgi:ABC-type nickel/cobalt efflux system permease component RcnA